MKNKNKAISGLLWRFIETFGSQGITFILSIVLARLLEPSAYGTLALVTVFTGIIGVFVDSGMGSALVQKKNADNLDFSTVFYFNLFMCSLLYLGLFIAAPWIAAFYDDPALTAVVRVLSLSLLFAGVTNIQNSYVSKHLLYKKFFFATLLGSLGSASVGIWMAYNGYGVWALVAQQLTAGLLKMILLWICVRWRPRLAFSLERLRGLFSFGWKMLASSLVDRVYNELRTLIIGKRYSAESLAYYNKGKQFPNQVILSINTSIDSILLPTMAEEQDDRVRVKAMTRRAIKTSTYLMAPIMIGMAVCAEELTCLILTEKWLPSVFFLRIFCLTMMFYPIHTANLNAIKAMGRSDWFLRLEIAKKTIGIASVLITMWISVEAMAYSLFVTTLISMMINAYPNKKLLSYRFLEQMKDILPAIAIALLMGGAVWMVGLLPLEGIWLLLARMAVGMAAYPLLSLLFRIDTFPYLIQSIKGFLKKEKNV